MSAKFVLVRFVQRQSVDLYSINEFEAAQIDLLADNLPPFFRSYNLIEIMTTGWAGTRGKNRVKRLPCHKALAYVNRLYAGGWVSDTEYNKAYIATAMLLCKVRILTRIDVDLEGLPSICPRRNV